MPDQWTESRLPCAFLFGFPSLKLNRPSLARMYRLLKIVNSRKSAVDTRDQSLTFLYYIEK